MEVYLQRQGREETLTLCIGEKVEIVWAGPQEYYYFKDWLFQCKSFDGGKDRTQRCFNFKFLTILGLTIILFKDKKKEVI